MLTKRESAARKRITAAVSNLITDLTSLDPAIRGQAREILNNLALAGNVLAAVCLDPEGPPPLDRIGVSE